MKKIMIEGKTIEIQDELYNYAKSRLFDLEDPRFYRGMIDTALTTGTLQEGNIKHSNVDEIIKKFSEEQLSKVINDYLELDKHAFD